MDFFVLLYSYPGLVPVHDVTLTNVILVGVLTVQRYHVESIYFKTQLALQVRSCRPLAFME